jgi:hypothetical protein
MRTKRIFPSALMLAVLSLASVHAQETLPNAPLTVDRAAEAPQPAANGAPATQPAPGMLSSWMTYAQPGCCGPMGGNGPILYELFVRSGASLLVDGKIISRALETGWVIEGGARSLFFNPALDRDWSIDLSISNTLNRTDDRSPRFPYNIVFAPINPITGLPGTPVPTTIQATLRELNRTDINAGLGYEWYLWGNAGCCNSKRWRVGIDGGGRFGSVKAEFNELSHHTDILGGVYAGLHTDWEFPVGGCCTFLAGIRAEWDYNWMDILQEQNNAQFMDVNLLLTFGVLF